MKQWIIIFIFLCCTASGFAQTVIDSLKKLIATEKKEDTARVKRLIHLSGSYLYNKPDSGFYYADQATRLSRKLGYKYGEAKANNNLGEANRLLGDYAQAMQCYLQAMDLFRKMNRPIDISLMKRQVGEIYKEIGDYKQALHYYFESKKIDEENFLTMPFISMEEEQVFFDVKIGEAYLAGDRLDSALFLAQRGFLTDRKLGKIKVGWWHPWSLAALVLGNVYLKRGQLDSALYCYQLTFNFSGQNDLVDINNGIATVYRKQNQIDSCRRYARAAFDTAQMIRYRKGIMRASDLLSWVYEKTAPVEAIRYYKISTTLKDSLYNQEKISRINILSFDEKLKEQELQAARIKYQNRLRMYALLTVVGIFLLIALFLWRNNRHRQRAYALLQEQKAETEHQKAKAETALEDLKSTQAQLIHSEKIASLGELTAGIAHEIQNPLNFVNNFSEVNTELIDELKEEVHKGNINGVKVIADNIKDNEQKILHHGKRADAIVKGMLQHSRPSTGKKEPTDINALADEYLRLSYHGMRAKDKTFNATLETDFDPTIGKINVVPQDIGRVLLNLFNNAFYAISETTRLSSALGGYQPIVKITTRKLNDKIEISVEDNGIGIPQKVVDKIFQPFFTTKPTGQGTGLGLSLSYDIIKAHGGEIKVETKEGEGSEFIIALSLN